MSSCVPWFNSYHKCYIHTLCIFSLFYSSKHQYTYPFLGVVSYRTPPSEYSKCLSLKKHWIFYVRYSFRSILPTTSLRISWRRAETVRWISEAITVSAKWAQQVLSGPSQKIGHHTLVTRSRLTCLPALSSSLWQPHRHSLTAQVSHRWCPKCQCGGGQGNLSPSCQRSTCHSPTYLILYRGRHCRLAWQAHITGEQSARCSQKGNYPQPLPVLL